ncbi:AsnC family transcriptional regulator [Rhodomicrobium udaipurense JA643]|uniref:Lrp/AsnC family transcriptional regulator n=1 Tax=Rhodomicrobium udaipurense TaxID=1202716 RepID=A0A8I1GEY3_9HYPH|nr:Lrp/AsnC family transcriptional regulator [Rhodomicrobium udaipurense]KAI96308.1 AsnC family transcriptional regulator [Rhodomicrobium udaipurense JA643]MBJ7542451.1 Lrp/AsnC family transcriptional regulator [Rhodomicrobium udaipurense]
MPGTAAYPLDSVDRTILTLLQADASLSTAEIAARAGASQSSVWRRIEKLEAAGIIQRRVAILDRKKLGLNMMVFAHVKLQAHGQRTLPAFEDAIRRFPEVVECHTLLGETDYLLRVITRDTESYETFFRKHLSQVASVQFTNSSMAISEVKSTTELPLSLLW